MTNKERLISLLGFSPGNINAVEGALLDHGIEGSDDYDPEETVNDVAILRVIKLAAVDVLRLLLSTPDTTTSTGGVTTNSMKYDRNAILKRIYALEVELEISEGPTIKAIHKW